MPGAFGPAERGASSASAIERSGEFDGTELALGIEVDGRLAGEVQARTNPEGMPPGVLESASSCSIRGPAGRVWAPRPSLLLTAIFEHEGAHRVQLTTDVDNAAMRSVSERWGSCSRA